MHIIPIGTTEVETAISPEHYYEYVNDHKCRGTRMMYSMIIANEVTMVCHRSHTEV